MLESPQAKIMGGILLLEVIIMSIIIGTTSSGMGMLAIPLYLLVAVPVSLLMVFDQNCVVIGGCNIWGWIRLFLFVLSVLFAVIAIFAARRAAAEAEKKLAAAAQAAEAAQAKEKK